MAIIAKYKFNSNLYADYLPVFNAEFTGYTKTDVNNGDGTITRTISHDTLKPTLMTFGNTSSITDREKSLLEVIECDTSKVTSMVAMFKNCPKLTLLDLSSFNTSNVTAMNSMFEGCASITTLDVSNFNTSSVNNMSGMFYNCNKLTSLDLSNFNTSSVNNTSYMFQHCSSLTSLVLSNFNTSNVTSMLNMFDSCSSLTSLDLSNFNTSEVVNMQSMFYNCKSLSSLDVSNFNTSNVTTMRGMFSECKSLSSLDVSNFNTSKVTTMEYIFNNCTALSDIGLIYASSSTINSLLTPLGTSVARNIYYMDAPLSELTVQDNITYKKYELSRATFPYTLNKLPNGVADYIDVVNKVHVQRVGKVVLDGTQSFTYKNEYSSSSYYGFLAVGLLSSNQATASSYGLCDKLKYQRNYNFSWSTDGEYVLINSASLFIKLSKDKLNSNNTAESLMTYLASNPITVLYELATPIYTPLTEEEIAQLPLSAYANGYVNLSSDQLMPSFEFRMKASNRYQVDMLETGYYYLNAPVGNVKLGTANVDVQQMPCIVKVDNVGTGDSGYRLGVTNGFYKDVKLTIDNYYVNIYGGGLIEDLLKTRAASDYVYIDYYEDLCIGDLGNREYFDMAFFDENKNFISYVTWDMVKNYGKFKAPQNAKYFRVSVVHKGNKIIRMYSPITLSKLPSHRIPTSFTQGMRCATDFEYWEGIKESKFDQLWTTNYDWSYCEGANLSSPIQLNRIEYGNTIVEDEFDIATGKLIKRVGVKLVTVEDIEKISNYGTDGNSYYCYGFESMFPNWKSQGIFKANGINYWKSHRQIEPSPFILEFYMSYIVGFSFDLNYSYDDKKRIIIDVLSNTGGFTVYYELEVPEISYLTPTKNIVKTSTDSKSIQINKSDDYLAPQVKPSHLTYPVPSLVGNRTYTVVHNRKNIGGSTKPIELNLGGTVVQLNDASSKTLVKTPSTLAHSNLIFIGGESTVDHIMVLDGDWTNKPIEYFENMMGHDTDAIITIIGNGQIDDVEEQYLW